MVRTAGRRGELAESLKTIRYRFRDMSATLTTDTQIQPTASKTGGQTCRFCGAMLKKTFVDLGLSPLCETYPAPEDLNSGEMFYPLHIYLCEQCFLVQLDEYETAENIFSDYAYFSSYSDSWLKHCENYCRRMISRFGLNRDSFVVEVASNDGYLLQYFVRDKIPVLGIEPAANVAKVAVEKGVPTLVRFFGVQAAKNLAAEDRRADLVLGNNVLAQVPDLNDFVEGLKILLKPAGILTLEFPHLLRLIERNEFDTIYHEHFSYFSMLTVARLLQAHGLKAFDVEELPTHGGSLRVYASRVEDETHTVQLSVSTVIADEEKAGLASPAGYESFAVQVRDTKLGAVGFSARAPDAREKRWLAMVHRARAPRCCTIAGLGGTYWSIRSIAAHTSRAGSCLAPTFRSIIRTGSGNQAGLRDDPALESERRNHGAVAIYPRMGRPLCRADTRSDCLLIEWSNESSSILWRSRHAAPRICG